MKRVFTRQSSMLALLLATSITLGSAGVVPADAKTLWNPMNWFSGETQVEEQEQDTAPSAEDLAVQKAEEAQQAADRALEEAQQALIKAEQAKKEVEALKQQATTHKKPVVTPIETENPAAETAATPTTETTENYTEQNQENRVYNESQETTSKSEPWNPLSWFKHSPSSATETPTASEEQTTTIKLTSPENKATERVTTETAETQASPEDTATPSKGTNWNPKNWFSKSAETANTNPAIETTTAKAAEPAADASVKTKAALLETEKGNIAIEFYSDEAPQTVNNFVELVGSGFYNRFNMKFHRVVPGFVVQTGDPTGTGAGGSKKSIPLEAKNKLSHNAKGVVAMARGADPNSATSQFYITLTPQTSLDGKYAIFGRVISGMDVLEKIEKDDMLYGIRLVDLNSVVRDASPDKKKFFSSLF